MRNQNSGEQQQLVLDELEVRCKAYRAPDAAPGCTHCSPPIRTRPLERTVWGLTSMRNAFTRSPNWSSNDAVAVILPAGCSARRWPRLFGGEAGAGVLLILVAAAALIAANSPLARGLSRLVPRPPGMDPDRASSTLHLWINDALMAVFFFVVGLEIKREVIDGQLADAARAGACRSWPRRPAWRPRRWSISLIAGGDAGLARGWAIPAATDIAFAVGVLGAARQARAAVAAAVPADRGDRRRHRRGGDHRAVLHRRDRAGLAGRGGWRCWPRWQRSTAAASASVWPYVLLAVVLWYLRAAFGRPRDRRRRARRADRSAATSIARGDSLLLRMEHALVPLERLPDRAAVRLRQRRGEPWPASALAALLAPLPLAIARGAGRRQAGGHLRRDRCSPTHRLRRAARAARAGRRSGAWRCCAGSASR